MGDPFAPRTPPPVAGVPPVGLADGRACAKGWLVRLVAGAPLDGAARVPVAALGADGPELCAAVLRAVGSDAALAALHAGGELAPVAARAGALAGAGSPAATAAALAALREAAWSALRQELHPAEDREIAVLDRLIHVCDTVLATTLAARGAPDAGLSPAEAVARSLGDRGGAVLLAEVDGVERLLAAERGGEVGEALARLEAEARSAAAGEAVALGPGRLVVVMPEADAAQAREQADRLAGAVAAGPTVHGAPLRLTVGVAVRPDDGADAATLLARADERLFAARAAGLTVAPALQPGGSA